MRRQEEAARRAERKRALLGPAAAVVAARSDHRIDRRANGAVGAGSVAVRGSDGSALRALKRRRVTTVSAMASVSVAGTAIAAVLLSANTGSTQVAASQQIDAAAVKAVDAEAVDAQIPAGQGDKSAGTADNYAGGVPSTKDRQAEAASRSVTRTVLPGCDGEAPGGQASNGQLPEGWLCEIGIGGHKLRADAAVSFAEMNADFKADTGKDMAITDTYRSLESQISVAGRKPGLAARPGTSLHGWGVAIDFGGGAATATGEQYEWLVKNAHKYGWENPEWAKTSKYEPWHWEYVPARESIRGY
nr:M15 family metallopeptidase [Brevibacterium daeguense]